MLNTPEYRLPTGRAVTFNLATRKWVAHWPERSPVLRQTEDTDLPKETVSIVPMLASPATPRFLFSPNFVLTTAGLVDGAPLVPEEALNKLRDPLRRSWRQVYFGNLNSPLPYTKAHAINRVLAQQRVYTTARIEGMALCGHQDIEDGNLSPITVYRGPCGLCSERDMVLSTCCELAREQLRPRFPLGSMAFYMHDSCADARAGDFTTAWAEYDRGLSVFMAPREEVFLYPMTCHHVLHGIAGDHLRTLVTAVVTGPSEVLQLVFGYLGRQTASALVAPLFGRTCVAHPSHLDAMDRTGPWATRTYTGALARLPASSSLRFLRCAHFHAVLTPMLLRHHAVVHATCAVLACLAQKMAVAMHQLKNTDAVPPGPEHGNRHRELMECWVNLYKLFHSFDDLVIGCLADVCKYDWDVQRAAITSRLYGNILLAARRVCEVGCPGNCDVFPVYDEAVDIVRGVPITRWQPTSVCADAIFCNLAVVLRVLKRPSSPGADTCGPRCFAPEYSNVVARWVSDVSSLRVVRWWQRDNKRGRSPRRFDEYDSDATEDYRVEETSDDDH